MARAAVREPAPRVTLVRSRTVENVDSIGFVVRRHLTLLCRQVLGMSPPFTARS